MTVTAAGIPVAPEPDPVPSNPKVEPFPVRYLDFWSVQVPGKIRQCSTQYQQDEQKLADALEALQDCLAAHGRSLASPLGAPPPPTSE